MTKFLIIILLIIFAVGGAAYYVNKIMKKVKNFISPRENPQAKKSEDSEILYQKDDVVVMKGKAKSRKTRQNDNHE